MSTASLIVPTSEPVFISHASADRMLINYFVEQLLIAGGGLSPSQIFYTSSTSSPISAGDNFNPRIRQAISGCKIVIALISKNYYRSPFCMSELGAAWAAQKLFPILVPPVDFGNLEGVLNGMHCIRLTDDNKIFEIYDRLGEADLLRPNRTGAFAAKVKDFLSSLPAQLAQLPVPDVVDRAEYKKLEDQLKDLSAKLQASATALEGLQTTARLATTAVSNKPVAPSSHPDAPIDNSVKPSGLTGGHTKEDSVFRSLIEEVNQTSMAVPSVIRRMVYARVLEQGDLFRVFESEGEEWESAISEGLVRQDVDGEYFLNFGSARVDCLHEAFKKIDSFWSTAGSGYRFKYEVSHRHLPSLHEPAFSRKWFGFWWEEDTYEIPF